MQAAQTSLGSAPNPPKKRQFRQKRNRYPHDRTVTDALYREVMRLHPALRANRGYRNLYAYIALGPHDVDRETGYIRIPSWRLALCEGKMHQYRAGNYRGEPFLRGYRRDVDPAFRWSRWSKQDNRPRVVIAEGTSKMTKRFLEEHNRELQRRYLGSGKLFNKHNQEACHREYVQAAQEQEWLYHDQGTIANYLHGLPQSLFKKQVHRHYQEAMDWALARGNAQDIMTLNAIMDEPMQLYFVDPPNARIFPHPGLATVKTDIRHILLRGWPEYDLVNCQAAILAGIWHVDSVQELLESGRSIWDYLLNELGVRGDQRKVGKEALKEPFYALAYGMETPHLTSFAAMQLQGIDRTNARPFLDVPLISDIARARDRALVRMERSRGARSAYGWMPYDGSTSIRTFLAHVVMTFELALVAAMFEAASERADFKIALYQYDGLTVTSGGRRVLQVLNEAVGKRGREHEIIARLH
jgi:hypothetical protein